MASGRITTKTTRPHISSNCLGYSVEIIVETNEKNRHILESCFDDCRDDEDDLESEIAEAFRAHDRDDDGFLDADDFRVALNKMGVHLSADESNEMIKMADLDRDGKINLSEFRRMMTESRPVRPETPIRSSDT